ncbi:sulfatase-like hydrolase/transferase [Streptococcus sp. FSL R7-0212]|uniref:LTA synthase family protein n=1 Tax=Streptococcus sp. FSL R7-0212 TaxID=2921726 RepID=UPI0030F6C30E
MKKNKFGKNWLGILNVVILFITTFIMNFYLVNKSILTNVAGLNINYKSLLSLETKFAFISLIIFLIYLSLYNNIKNFIKSIISIVVYLLISIFIRFSSNLNNIKIDYISLLKNEIISNRALIIIVVLLLISLVFHYLILFFEKFDRFEKVHLNTQTYEIIIGYLVSLIAFASSNISIFYSESIPNLTQSNGYFDFVLLTLIITFVLFALFSTIVLLFLKGFRQLIHLDMGFSISLSTSLIFAILLNFLLQYGVKADSDFMGIFYFDGATFFQITLLTLVFILFYAILNDYLISTLLVILTTILIGVVNFVKVKMRSEPLLITDIVWIKDIKLILSFLDKKYLLYLILLVVIPSIIYFVFKKKFKNVKSFNGTVFRTTTIVIVFLLLFSVYQIFRNEKKGKIIENIPVLSKLNNSLDIAYMGHLTNSQYKSVSYVWIKQISKPVMEKPYKYSKKQISKIVKKYSKRADEINATRNNNITDETVIFILSESFSKPERLPGVSISKEILPNIKEIEDNNTSGLMKSDGYGGGTANMELQSLIGLPYYNLSPAVSVMNTEIVPKMSYIPSISNYFSNKNKIAIHLGDSHTYSRKDVYNRMGFDTFVASEGTGNLPTISEKLGLYPSDKSTYQNVLDKIDKKNSQFFSVITFQNHVPWLQEQPADIAATGENFDENQLNSLNSYVKLMYATDIETKSFLDSLKKIDKKISVVFYGDHLPSFYPNSIFKENPNLKYETDFFIWSNYKNKKYKYSKVNSSDFPALLLKHTNSKVSPYDALLTDVLEKASIDKNNLDNDGKEIKNDLKIIQYDIIFGSRYLKHYKSFFNLK